MRCVVQRVAHASVTVNEQKIAAIGAGYLVLVGVEDGDGENDMIYCADKIAGLRIFEDENGKMNLRSAYNWPSAAFACWAWINRPTCWKSPRGAPERRAYRSRSCARTLRFSSWAAGRTPSWPPATP